jgi:hypothetical protein
MPRIGVARHPDGTLEEALGPAELARLLAVEGAVGWLDLEAPTADEVQALEGPFGLHHLALEDAQNPETRPKIEEYDGFLFVVTRGPNHEREGSAVELVPLFVFLNRRVIVTIHDRPMHSVATAHERLRKHPELLRHGPDRLLHHLLDQVVDHYFPLVEALEERIEALETQVFRAVDTRLLEDIFATRKEVAALRRSLGPLREVVSNLTGGVPYVDDDLRSRPPPARGARDEPGHPGRAPRELSLAGQQSHERRDEAADGARDDRTALHDRVGLLRHELRGDAMVERALGRHRRHADDDRDGGRGLLRLPLARVAVTGSGRPGRAPAVVLLGLLAAGAGAPPGAGAIVPELGPAEIQQAIDAGEVGLAREDFADEWRLLLPGGEEVVVSTPFSRLALAARQAAYKEEPLTDKQRQEQLDRGRGRIQLLVTMYGRQMDFARWYQAVLRVGEREIKATFAQNERTPRRLEDGRLAARNVYVFPLEGLPPRGTVTLIVRNSIDQKEVLRAALDLGKMR